MKSIFKVLTLALALSLFSAGAQAQIVQVHDGKLWRGSHP